MQVSPFQALVAVQRPAQTATATSTMVIAGAGGVLGNAVLRRLVGLHRYAHTRVLAREPMAPALRQVGIHVVHGEIAHWPVIPADVAVVMFDPPSMFYGRERALWVISGLTQSAARPAAENRAKNRRRLNACRQHVAAQSVAVRPHHTVR